MFVCGPTVQSEIHVGHARTYIFFDALARYLGHSGYDVFFLVNVTDIDEAVTRAASAFRQEPLAYSELMTASLLDDFAALNIKTISRVEPVSHHVNEMVRQISSLLDKGFAYRAGKWVYFDTTKFAHWGRLSHQSKSEMALRPLELSPMKKSLNDFALWRPEVLVKGRWDSPWGLGSPGWHIQDTAVTVPVLGSRYDIHGGAYELVYPHHEAEIAEAESFTGTRPLVKYWVHTNHLKAKGEKMSKSTGNAVTVKRALRSYTADEIRFASLSVHYRRETDLSSLDSAKRRLRAIRPIAAKFGQAEEGEAPTARFKNALDDDFDTPKALGYAERALRAAAKETDRDEAQSLAKSAVAGLKILGIDLLENS